MLVDGEFLEALDLALAAGGQRDLPASESPLLELTKEALAPHRVKHEIAGIKLSKRLGIKRRGVVSAAARNARMSLLLGPGQVDD